MCSGVVKIEKNGDIQGVKTNFLDYSNKIIKSIKIYEELAQTNFN